ncbi:glutathione S-transferase family protein [Pseudorhodobacter sp. W20_MBD10_FR17]|uniref:glutathione S-transferase family protein n=1 Tax=Pseudorhodobacter sp. W20_MBD10_FR17 TaxID=3240266 RepID=UPI003F9E730D
MLKLYHTPTSVCSIKVRLGMAEIGLDYESEILDFSKSEQHGESYLQINPDGVVPTLIDDGFVVVESSLILEYLDAYYNDGKLIPKDRKLATTARHWLLRTLAIHSAINTITFSTGARDQILASKTSEEIAASISKMPDPVAQLKRKELLANGLNSAYVNQAFGQLQRAFKDMETALADRKWVTAAEFGISDIALLSYIDRLDRLGFSGLLGDESSKIVGWLARMKARPSYDIAIAQHIPQAVADKTRQAGEKHWPEVERLWTARLGK